MSIARTLLSIPIGYFTGRTLARLYFKSKREGFFNMLSCFYHLAFRPRSNKSRLLKLGFRPERHSKKTSYSLSITLEKTYLKLELHFDGKKLEDKEGCVMITCARTGTFFEPNKHIYITRLFGKPADCVFSFILQNMDDFEKDLKEPFFMKLGEKMRDGLVRCDPFSVKELSRSTEEDCSLLVRMPRFQRGLP